MLTSERILQNKKIAGFRYSLIAELTNKNLSESEIKKLIKEKASRTYDIPYSKKTKVTVKSIKRWLRAFNNVGLDGITPKVRNDYGISKCLTLTEQDTLINYLEKHPYLTAKQAFLECQKKRTIENDISSSSLSRLINAHGMDKKSRTRKNNNEVSLKFNFRYPLECVQSDYMHAFNVPDSKGKMKKAKLLCFLDDATRKILYAKFTFDESALEFETGLKTILSVHGRFPKIYTDNGPCFVSGETKRILSTLGIKIIHSRPYRPQGKAKQERAFRTVRDQFIRPIDQSQIKSLEQLNIMFNNWVETEYHRTPHSGLNNKTPLDAWLSGTRHIIPIDPTIDLDDVFLHQVKRKVNKDSTFSLDATLYEVPSSLIGKTIMIKYDPVVQMKDLAVYLDGNYICDANPVDSYENTKVSRNILKKQKNDLSVKKSANTQENNKTTKTVLEAAQLDI